LISSAVVSLRNERNYEKKPKQQGDHRTPAQRDRDRVLYSSAFRRLAEVTQVVAANSGYIFHNRLTHSLQVAQVGRRLSEKLVQLQNEHGMFPADGIDPDVVEAACLAHDLGHPPFGHVIEEQLNELGKAVGGFEGNAQSFRIVTKLAFHSPKYSGLDLTRATLAALLKYPWARGENEKKPNKWGYFQSEKDDFEFARSFYKPKYVQTTEAFLMDWADDITYSVHDLEDFYRAGRLPLHLLSMQTDSREREYFFEQVFARHEALKNTSILAARKELESAFTEVSRLFPPMQEYRGTIKQRTSLRNFTGSLIGRYINGVSFSDQDDLTRVVVEQQFKNEVTMLKELIWIYVIQDPALATQQFGQRHMIKLLFEIYVDAAQSRKDWKVFPTYYQERLNNEEDTDEKTRTCIDLIAGMTETQVHRIYSRLTGVSTESSLNDPLR
jgi:dGTPase